MAGDPDSSGLSPSPMERELTQASTTADLAGAGPTAELSSQTVADPDLDGPSPSGTEREPTSPKGRTTQGCTSVERTLDAKARAAVRREATSNDLGLRLWLTWSHGLHPMCPDSDGF